MNKTLSIKVWPFLSKIAWKFYNLNTIIGCRFSSQAYKILGEWFYDDPSSDATPRCHVSTKILRKRMPIKENLHYTLWSNIRNFIPKLSHFLHLEIQIFWAKNLKRLFFILTAIPICFENYWRKQFVFNMDVSDM